MRTLFFRIFLWFWLAMALVGAVLFFTSLWSASRPFRSEWRERTAGPMALFGDTAEIVFSQGGTGALQGLVRGLDARGSRTGVFLFGPEGSEVIGQAPPGPVRALARRAGETRAIEVDRRGGSVLVARPVLSPEGIPHVLVLRAERPPRPPPLLGPADQLVRLAILVVLSGGVCYWLARTLASPVGALRKATAALAGGDLSVRVGDTVGRRGDEIGDLARGFDSMAERVETAILSQKRLLRDISHELRSPLARLNVALELARRRAGSEAGTALDRIALESERLEALTGRLLTLTRLEAGTDNQEWTEVDLGALLREVVEDARFEAHSRNRAVEMKGCEPCRIRGAAELLRSAIENVIRNAVQYTAEGSCVEVTLEPRKGGEAGPRGLALIRVRDHGPGIPEGDLEKVFRPFFRVAEARDRQTGGAGLGLAIAARAVQIHGGSIAAANAPEGGLIVELTLPACRDALP